MSAGPPVQVTARKVAFSVNCPCRGVTVLKTPRSSYRKPRFAPSLSPTPLFEYWYFVPLPQDRLTYITNGYIYM
jgi:hypothetical protein